MQQKVMLFLPAKPPVFAFSHKFIAIRTLHQANGIRIGFQPQFLPQLAPECFAQGLAKIHAALGKLPRTGKIAPLGNENAPIFPQKNSRYIWAVFDGSCSSHVSIDF